MKEKWRGQGKATLPLLSPTSFSFLFCTPLLHTSPKLCKMPGTGYCSFNVQAKLNLKTIVICESCCVELGTVLI